MARQTWVTNLRTFMKGMAKDILKELLPADKYFEAENVTVTSQQEGTAGGLTPALGTEFSVERETIDIEDPADDYKGFRVKIDLSPGVVHAITYTIPSSAPVTINVSSGLFTASARYADLVSQINADAFLEVYITPTLTSQTEVFIGVRGYGSDFTLTETISAISTDVFVIKEFYGITHNGDFVLLKSLNIGDNLYQIETNGSVFKWSVAKHDRQADTWRYVTLLQTVSIQIPVDAVIDLDGEINNGNKVSLYFTGEGVEPRALYVQLQDTWVENSAMIYDETFPTIENEDGFYTYDNIDQISRVQIIENYARARLQQVNDTGGSLKSGSKIYLVRQSIGRDNATGFYDNSTQIPIFVKSLSDSRLYGDVAGINTSKSITLSIEGLNPSIYDFYELVCIENNDGALATPYIVGQYPITSIVQSVTHTGFEETIDISFAEISIAQIIIKNANNLTITRNRLFLSNLEIAEEPDLSEFAESIPITTARTTLPAVGTLYSSVGEYQDPNNVANKLGYFIDEIYRFGIIFYFNNKSPYRGVSRPYFVGDHNIDTTSIGSVLVNNTVTGPPTEIYVYHPRFTVNLIGVFVNGLPLADVIDGYSIVRVPCIPEVLATGYCLPASQAGEAVLTDFYTAGACVNGGLPYSEASNSSRRTQISFYSPDIIFGTTDITPLQGDRLYNYGQVRNYGGLVESGGVSISEKGPHDPNITRVQHIISHGEVVPFNTDGNIDINGARLRNLVFYSFAGPVDQVQGNNQKSIAIALTDFMNPLTTNVSNLYEDRGIYYNIYKRLIPDKYGPKTQGQYISCGHFTQIDHNDTTPFYIDDLFGGDCYTQKSILKFCNFATNDPSNPATYAAFGITVYSQNRGNYQLRNFTNGTTTDYPYTTTSLLDWIDPDTQREVEGQLKYSLSYTPTVLVLPKVGYNPDIPFVANESNILRYSQQNIQGSSVSSYRIFLPLDFKPFPAIYGSIKNTFNFGNAIVVMMDRYIGIQQVDLQQQQTDPSNQTTIIIGDGTVLGAREQDISFIGAPIKTAGYSYLSKFGKKYFVWFNPDYKKVLQYSQNGIRDLFEENNMQSFLTLNTTYIKDERSFFFCYDYYTSELLMFAKAALDAGTVYDGEEQYTKGQIVFTEGGYTNTRYYIATQSVINNKSPENVGNLFLYWKPYRQSNFALAYNEQSNNITSFYSYTPQYPLMPYMNTFLSSPDSLLLSRNVYEHNRFTNKFYLDDIKAFVNSIVNDNDSITKQAINLQMNSNISPIALVFKSNSDTVTYSEQSDIKRQRNLWWSVVKNDATVSANNPTGINSLMTAQINGEFIEVTIFLINNADQVNTLSSVAMTVVEKPPVISNR